MGSKTTVKLSKIALSARCTRGTFSCVGIICDSVEKNRIIAKLIASTKGRDTPPSVKQRICVFGRMFRRAVIVGLTPPPSTRRIWGGCLDVELGASKLNQNRGVINYLQYSRFVIRDGPYLVTALPVTRWVFRWIANVALLRGGDVVSFGDISEIADSESPGVKATL